MKKKALIIADRFDEVFSQQMIEGLSSMVDVIAPPQASDIIDRAPELLREVEVILSTWGSPVLDEKFLAAAPALELFLYGAGATQMIIKPAVWRRNIAVSSAIHLNSVPVAEYTLAHIILALKQNFQANDAYKNDRAKNYSTRKIAGAYRSKVGLIGFGNVARILLDLLRNIDVEVLVYDPNITEEVVRSLGVKKVSLAELFAESDVVSLHAPEIPSTKGMVTGELLRSMKHSATFINTSRGSLVREDEFVEVYRERPDLFAVLDVTAPEPPEFFSDLWSLRNILLTPHISGSQGLERFRLGQAMIDELSRYINGEDLKWRVNPPAIYSEATI